MLRVITGGLQTTVQDLGRTTHQREGVPVSGAMDRIALRIANLLVGNDEGAAALEASLIGPAVTFERDSVIALTGANLEATVDDTEVPAWHPVWVRRGTTLRFGRARTGCRAYVAIGGGIDVPMVFGSRSTYLRAKFGGHEGRALKSGDVLGLGAMSPQADRMAEILGSPDRRFVVARWSIAIALRPQYTDDVVVRMIAGAHLDLLSDAAREALLGSTFRVSSNSDRMGYRLEGTELSLRQPIELLSEGVAFGTVQLPPGGAPIVLMADAQTTGGYPRIGELASVDLPLVAQLKPGDRLRIRLISLDDAQAMYLAREQDIAQARRAIAFRHSRSTP
jgi:antagonist of KipI